MGAEFSQLLQHLGASRSQPQPQEQQLSQPESQQQPEPEPEQQQQQQVYELSSREAQQLSQPESQQQQQPQEHEQSSREACLLPLPQGDAVETSGTQSLTPVKPLKELNFPHNYQDILKDADSPVDTSSRELLCDQLCTGVFLDNKTKKYWLEKKSNGNCFMLYARTLSIIWADSHMYWKWVPQKEASGTLIEVAELKKVAWLEVSGSFDTRNLSPGILYEVSFLVMFKDPVQGWDVPVNFRLVVPGVTKDEHNENFMDKLRGRWIEIPIGEFVASAQDVGEMEFSMYEFNERRVWKQGLVIKGVAIKPKN